MQGRHLTSEERSQISLLKAMKVRQKEMARLLGVAPSTISRELNRNTCKEGYQGGLAHVKAVKRRQKASRQPKRMTAVLVMAIEDKLVNEQWSPEQIAGHSRRNGTSISTESIYRHVRADRKAGGKLFEQLRHRGKKYNRKGGKTAGRGCIPNRVGIEKRPQIVERKRRFGDWEVDLIIGANHQGAILSMVERNSKYTMLVKLKNKNATGVRKAIIRALKTLPKHRRRTLTFDNGKEFAQHEKIAKALAMACYFAAPYRSWERGLNEHVNGLVRQYVPKKTNFREVSREKIREIAAKLNRRPRKVLGYLTAEEVILGKKLPKEIAFRS